MPKNCFTNNLSNRIDPGASNCTDFLSKTGCPKQILVCNFLFSLLNTNRMPKLEGRNMFATVHDWFWSYHKKLLGLKRQRCQKWYWGSASALLGQIEIRCMQKAIQIAGPGLHNPNVFFVSPFGQRPERGTWRASLREVLAGQNKIQKNFPFSWNKRCPSSSCLFRPLQVLSKILHSARLRLCLFFLSFLKSPPSHQNQR